MKPKLSPGIIPGMLCFGCQIFTLGQLRKVPSYSPFAAQIDAYPAFALWLARILSVLTLAVIILYVSQTARPLGLRRVTVPASIALVGGSALAIYGSSTLAMYLLSQVLVGISHAVILACWAETFSSMDASSRNRTISFGALAAVIAFTAVNLLPEPVRAAAFLILAVGSAAPFVVKAPRWLAGAGGESAGVGEEDRGATAIVPETSRGTASAIAPETSSPTGFAALKRALASLPTELVVLMASYAMVFRMLNFFDFPIQGESLLVSCEAVLRIGGMVAVIVYLARARFEPNARQIIMPLLLLTLVGAALLPVQNPSMATVSVAIVQSSWTFFYTLMWLVLLSLRPGNSRRSLLVFLCGWTVLNTLLLVAAPLAMMLEAQVSAGVLSLTALALVIVYTLAVGLLLYRRKNVEADGGNAGAPASPDGQGSLDGQDSRSWKDGQAAFYRSMATDHNLTQRETDVFELLAQGRSLPAIEERFCLSHSTVKGHVRSIYQKFGVTTKQELLEKLQQLHQK